MNQMLDSTNVSVGVSAAGSFEGVADPLPTPADAVLCDSGAEARDSLTQEESESASAGTPAEPVMWSTTGEAPSSDGASDRPGSPPEFRSLWREIGRRACGALSLPYLRRAIVAILRKPQSIGLGLSCLAGVWATRDFLKHSLRDGVPLDSAIITAALLVLVGTTMTLAGIPALISSGVRIARQKHRAAAPVHAPPADNHPSSKDAAQSAEERSSEGGAVAAPSFTAEPDASQASGRDSHGDRPPNGIPGSRRAGAAHSNRRSRRKSRGSRHKSN